MVGEREPWHRRPRVFGRGWKGGPGPERKEGSTQREGGESGEGSVGRRRGHIAYKRAATEKEAGKECDRQSLKRLSPSVSSCTGH